MNRQFVMYLINIINYQTLCPNPYSRLGCGMILKSATHLVPNDKMTERIKVGVITAYKSISTRFNDFKSYNNVKQT